MLRRTPLRRVGRKGRVYQALDALLRQAVLARDGYLCRKCGLPARPGRGGALQAAHIKGKGAHPALRYELDNVIALHATPCHLYWWHGADPLAVTAWAREHLGAVLLERLEFLAIARRPRFDATLTRLHLEQALHHYDRITP